jgi:hypothetical protein
MMLDRDLFDFFEHKRLATKTELTDAREIALE